MSFTQSINVLQQAGVLVVAAAGNEQQDNDEIARRGYPNAPASVNLDAVVAVAAIDASGGAWSEGAPNAALMVPGTNRGQITVDMGAPGAQIVAAQAAARGARGIESRRASTCWCSDVQLTCGVLTRVRAQIWHVYGGTLCGRRGCASAGHAGRR